MTTDNTPSIAQLAERFLHRTALGVLLMALAYALAAAMYLVSEPLEQRLDLVQLVLAMAAVIVVLPGFVRMLRVRMARGTDCADADSYIGEQFRKACVMAFSITFVVLAVAGPVSRQLPSDLPPDFYIQSVLALSLGAFSATFFVSLWRDRDEGET